MMRILLFTFIFSALFPAPLPAQLLNMQKIELEEGLSNNYVFSIAQDNKGFIWFATAYGLNRFDGTRFTAYMNDPAGQIVTGNDVRSVKNDKAGNKLWIGTCWNGVNVFDCAKEKFTLYQHDPDDPRSLSSDNISDILITKKGDIWISTIDAGLNRFDSSTNRFDRFNRAVIPSLLSDNINCIAESDKGYLYIGYLEGGFTMLNLQDNQVTNYLPAEYAALPEDIIHCIYTDRNERVWIGTGQGVCVFDTRTETFRNLYDIADVPQTLINQAVFSFMHSTDGRFWIGTTSDLCYFDADDMEDLHQEKSRIYSVQIDNVYTGQTNPTILSLLEDDSYNLWIGTNGGGVRFISKVEPFFHAWEAASIPGVINGMSDKEACTICVDDNGRIWIGADGGGINVYENGIHSEVYSKESGDLTVNAFFASLKDSKGNLWFGGMYTDINIYDVREKRFRYYQTLHPTNVNFFYEDREQNIWIGTDHGIEIYDFHTGRKRLMTTDNSGLSGNCIQTILQDAKERFWIGTINKGISLYDPSVENFIGVNTHTGLCSDMIRCIFRDSKNRIWVGTGDGLVLFPTADISEYRIYTMSDGLECSYIRAIQEDDEGNIWISTNTGISCFLQAEDKFLNYNHRDGTLFGDYMNNSAAKDADGIIYFGSARGVCYFDPCERPQDIPLPPAVFTEFAIHEQFNKDQIIPIDRNKVSLDHAQNTFTVSFGIMNYAFQKQVEYLYMLEGFDDTWYRLGHTNHITFHNIPYKNYTLLVKARLRNQQWPDTSARLSIFIQPPFWLSPWAKGTYFLLLAGGVIFMALSYNRRLKLRNTLLLEEESRKRQQEMNEERLKFYTNVTHELRTPLTLILGPLEDFRSESNLNPVQSRRVSLIHQNATRLLNLVTQILEFRKTETQNRKLFVRHGNLAEVVRETGLKYKELNRNPHILFSVFIETEKTNLWYDPEAITIILDNLLSNAFKYTGKGFISLILRSVTENELEYTEIEVVDTGCGISDKDITRIFERYYQANERPNTPGTGIGLALVNNLVNLHQGEINVSSKPGAGTSFRIRLLTQNTYPDAIHLQVKEKLQKEEEKESKPILLVVEDNPDVLEYVTGALTDHYEVITAEDGAEGLELAFMNIPDIIVSDIIMPVKNGIDLCRELKRDIRTSHIPVILLTAKDTLLDKAEGYNAGADSYITKPFSAVLLRSRILNLLDNRRKIADIVASNTSLKQSILKESLNKIDNDFLDKFTEIVEQNLQDEELDIASIANQMNMSYSSLYRKIKALTSMSINEFIRKIKIRKAEELLLSGECNVSEIAYRVGFNSVAYFRKCFKEEFGDTPTEYLRKIRSDL